MKPPGRPRGRLTICLGGLPLGRPVGFVTMLQIMLHGLAASQWKLLKMLGTACNMSQHEKGPLSGPISQLNHCFCLVAGPGLEPGTYGL